MQVNALWLHSHSLPSWPAVVFFVAALCHPSDSHVEITFAYTHSLSLSLCLSLSLSLYSKPSSGNHTTNMALCHRVFVKKYPISKKIYRCILRWTSQVASEHVEVTPCSRTLPEKVTGSQLVKNFPAYYGTQRFMTAFTRTRHMCLFWIRTIQYMPPILLLKIHFNIIVPSTPES